MKLLKFHSHINKNIIDIIKVVIKNKISNYFRKNYLNTQ